MVTNQNTDDERRPERWASDNSRKIIYRAVAIGTLILKTPAHFGSGESVTEKLQNGEKANVLELYKDPHDNCALLPGASLAGALRHYLVQRTQGYRKTDTQTSHAKILFGEALDLNRGEQSRLIIHDAYSQQKAYDKRDGVKIDGKHRTADVKDGALFQIETWNKDTEFPLHLELVLYEGDDVNMLKRVFAVLLKALADGNIPMGARKNRGYGRCDVTNWLVYEYDLTRVDHFLAWVNNKLSSPATDFMTLANSYTTDNRQRVTLEATFRLCDSLMIRQYPPESKEPDDKKEPIRHLTNLAGEHLLTGTSIAGALRARAVKIANTIGGCTSLTPDIVDAIFGAHGTSDEDKSVKPKSHASRLIVEETTIQDGDMSLIQTRVKIDRFTGGAYHSALINEQPVFAKPATIITINLELRAPEDAHIGLLLLLLKDLWTEDLPLGGESSIGRGRLQGVSASMTITGKSDSIQFNQHGLLNANQKDDLQGYINKLWGKS